MNIHSSILIYQHRKIKSRLKAKKTKESAVCALKYLSIITNYSSSEFQLGWCSFSFFWSLTRHSSALRMRANRLRVWRNVCSWLATVALTPRRPNGSLDYVGYWDYGRCWGSGVHFDDFGQARMYTSFVETTTNLNRERTSRGSYVGNAVGRGEKIDKGVVARGHLSSQKL
jgi:hypothetical protein